MENKLAVSGDGMPQETNNLATSQAVGQHPDLTNREGLEKISQPADFSFLKNISLEHATKARSQLATHIASLLQQRLGEEEKKLVGDILLKIIQDVELDIREMLAERLAVQDHAPIEIISFLANDTISVAAPILTLSKLLSDSHLLEVIDKRTPEHWRLIARRSEVSLAVSERLVNTGDAQTVENLVENEGSNLSEASIVRIIDTPSYAQKTFRAVLGRRELSTDLALQLIWGVSRELRQFMLDRFKISQEVLDSHLEAVMDQFPLSATQSIDTSPAMMVWAQKMVMRGVVDPDMLVRVLRRGRVGVFMTLISVLSELPLPFIRHIMVHNANEKLAMICRHIGVEKPDFASIFLLSRSARPGDHRVDPQELSRVLAFYDRITESLAKNMMMRWRSDPNPL